MLHARAGCVAALMAGLFGHVTGKPKGGIIHTREIQNRPKKLPRNKFGVVADKYVDDALEPGE